MSPSVFVNLVEELWLIERFVSVCAIVAVHNEPHLGIQHCRAGIKVERPDEDTPIDGKAMQARLGAVRTRLNPMISLIGACTQFQTSHQHRPVIAIAHPRTVHDWRPLPPSSW